jgi:hypothetical protein
VHEAVGNTAHVLARIFLGQKLFNLCRHILRPNLQRLPLVVRERFSGLRRHVVGDQDPFTAEQRAAGYAANCLRQDSERKTSDSAVPFCSMFRCEPKFILQDRANRRCVLDVYEPRSP